MLKATSLEMYTCEEVDVFGKDNEDLATALEDIVTIIGENWGAICEAQGPVISPHFVLIVKPSSSIIIEGELVSGLPEVKFYEVLIVDKEEGDTLKFFFKKKKLGGKAQFALDRAQWPQFMRRGKWLGVIRSEEQREFVDYEEEKDYCLKVLDKSVITLRNYFLNLRQLKSKGP